MSLQRTLYQTLSQFFSLLNFRTTLLGRNVYSHFTVKVNEIQRSEVTCSRTYILINSRAEIHPCIYVCLLSASIRYRDKNIKTVKILALMQLIV